MGQRDPRRDQRPPEPRFNPLAPGALGLPEGLVDDVRAVAESLDHLDRLGVNLLAPVTRIDFIPPGYRLAFRAVMFPCEDYPDGEGWVRIGGRLTNGTWYESEGGGLALHKPALRQLASAAGLSWETWDTSTDTNRWTIKAVARHRTMDGQWRQVSAMKDLDLRDDGPVVPTWEADAKRQGKSAGTRVLKAREHGGRMAEAKAVNAVIRDTLGLRTSYPLVLAQRPFVFPMLVWAPVTSEALQLQAAVELGVVSQLYGPNVIEATAEPVTEARQLEDKGPVPDYQAEAERLEQRERVKVQAKPTPAPAQREAVMPFDPADPGWNPDW